MRSAVMHPPGDVRVEEREAPRIIEPSDAIIRVTAACVMDQHNVIKALLLP